MYILYTRAFVIHVGSASLNIKGPDTRTRDAGNQSFFKDTTRCASLSLSLSLSPRVCFVCAAFFSTAAAILCAVMYNYLHCRARIVMTGVRERERERDCR